MKLWTVLVFPLAALAQVVPGNLQRELRDFLRLTDAQYESILRNRSRHLAAQAGTLMRVNTLNRDIDAETRREQPDPGALGASYFEIESQCRRADESLRDLNQLQLRVLNDEQRAALGNLAGLLRLRVLAPLAEAVFLIPMRDGTSSFRWFDLTLVNDVPADLAVYLRLTSAQLEAIRNAVRGHRDFVASRRARVAEVNQEIEAEMARPAPSSLELGLRYWEIEAHRRQIEEREASLRRTLPELLDAEQRARLSELIQPDERLRAAGQAQSDALIVASPAALPASQAGYGGLFVSPNGAPITDPTRLAPGRTCIGVDPFAIFDPIPL